MIREVTLANLDKLDDGKASIAFQRHLQRAVADCLDRPNDAKARVVVLKVAIVPVVEQDGGCREANAQIHVESKVPVHRTKTYSFGVRANASMVFNEDSLDDVSQKTIFDNEPDDD